LNVDATAAIFAVSRAIANSPDRAATAAGIRDQINAYRQGKLMSRKFMMSFKSATEVKQQFDGVHLKQLMDLGALKFGEFKLKSGRVSPYYFSSSFLCSGKGLHEIGRLGKKL
jgi:hypothetical protein